MRTTNTGLLSEDWLVLCQGIGDAEKIELGEHIIVMNAQTGLLCSLVPGKPTVFAEDARCGQ